MCAEHTKISVQIIEIKTIYKYNKSRPWLCGAALLLRAIIDQVFNIYVYIYIKGGSYPQT